jgi:imidazolonepropionase-like amidohydrolase
MPSQHSSGTFTVHTSLLFDPRSKKFVNDISITVHVASGSVTNVYKRTTALSSVADGDIDLRDKVVMPGFVDAHTHIFLHSYE